MSEDVRHFIAFIALGLIIAALVAVPIALARRRRAMRRQLARRNRIDLLTPVERGE